MLKLKYATPYMNALPGYTKYATFESIRKIPNPSVPMPMNFEDIL